MKQAASSPGLVPHKHISHLESLRHTDSSTADSNSQIYCLQQTGDSRSAGDDSVKLSTATLQKTCSAPLNTYRHKVPLMALNSIECTRAPDLYAFPPGLSARSLDPELVQPSDPKHAAAPEGAHASVRSNPFPDGHGSTWGGKPFYRSAGIERATAAHVVYVVWLLLCRHAHPGIAFSFHSSHASCCTVDVPESSGCQ